MWVSSHSWPNDLNVTRQQFNVSNLQEIINFMIRVLLSFVEFLIITIFDEKKMKNNTPTWARINKY